MPIFSRESAVPNPCGKVQRWNCANRGLQACFYDSLPFSEQQCSAFSRQMQCQCHGTARSQNTADVSAHPWAGFFLHEFHSAKSNEL